MKTKFYLFLFVSVFIAPSFLFAADETLTITTYYPSPYGSYNEFKVASNTWLAYSSGNVGIGTTAPGEKLQVVGNIAVSGISNNDIKLWTAGDNNWRVGMNTSPGFTKAMVTSYSTFLSYAAGAADQGLAFGVNGGNSSMEIQGTTHNVYFRGNVGIGTVSPGGRVSIYDATPTQPPLFIDRGYDGARIHFAYGGYDTTGAVGMTFYQAGKISLWMGANLKGTAASHTGPLQANIAGPSWYTEYNTISDYLAINRIAAGGGSSTPFYINSSGNIGIGTASPQAKLHLYDNTNQTFTSLLRLRAVTGGEGSREYELGLANDIQANHLVLRKTSDANPGMFSIRMSGQSNYDFIIRDSGYVGIGTASPGYKFQVYIDASNEGHVDSTGAWARTSDIRYKKNVSDLKDGLAKVLKLRPVRYDSRTEKASLKGQGRHAGFIAQELEKVIPGIVSTDSKGYKAIAYGELTPFLVEAVQQQQKLIAEQAQVNASMRKELDEIKVLLKRKNI